MLRSKHIRFGAFTDHRFWTIPLFFGTGKLAISASLDDWKCCGFNQGKNSAEDPHILPREALADGLGLVIMILAEQRAMFI